MTSSSIMHFKVLYFTQKLIKKINKKNLKNNINVIKWIFINKIICLSIIILTLNR